MVFEQLVFEDDGDYRDMLTTRRTYLNRTLAAIYNVPAPAREGFGETLLPVDGGRIGLLGHSSVLALNSHAVANSPTLRGKFVRESILCHAIPPPPSDVDTSIPEPTAEAATLRERVAIHLEDPGCASCHLVTDPIGLGLENFDALGRYRTLDNGMVIDASGDLDGVDFADNVELARVLHDHKDVGPCFAHHLYRYAHGHAPAVGERDAMDALGDGFARSGFKVQQLMVDTVMGPAFRKAAAIDTETEPADE